MMVRRIGLGVASGGVAASLGEDQRPRARLRDGLAPCELKIFNGGGYRVCDVNPADATGSRGAGTAAVSRSSSAAPSQPNAFIAVRLSVSWLQGARAG